MPHPLRQAVADASRRLADAGLLIGTAGNVSAFDGEHLAITATGVELAATGVAEVSVIDLDGRLVEGDLAPSSEHVLHSGVYRAAADAGVRSVVHTHSPVATAVGLVVDEVPVVHYQQLSLGGSIRVAPFEVFGTPELAAAVGTALQGRMAALLANHGAVTLGASLEAAVENALLLEWVCDLYWRARAIGEPRTLDEAQQVAVIEHALRIGYGSPREADA